MKMESASHDLVVRVDGVGGEDVKHEAIERAKAIDAVAFDPTRALSDPAAVLEEVVSFVEQHPPPSLLDSVGAGGSGSSTVLDVVMAKMLRRVLSVLRTFFHAPSLVAHITAHPKLLPLIARMSVAMGSVVHPTPAPSTSASVTLAEAEARVLQLEGSVSGYDNSKSRSGSESGGVTAVSAGAGLAAHLNRAMSAGNSLDLKLEDFVLAPAGPWAPISCTCSDPQLVSTAGNPMLAIDSSARSLRAPRPTAIQLSQEYSTMIGKVLVREGSWVCPFPIYPSFFHCFDRVISHLFL
jgi:hypothetical protein